GLFRRIFLQKLLRWAGNSIHRREDARFRRTQVFGLVRSIFLAIGTLFEHNKIITSSRDIFYLTTEEIFSLIREQNSAFLPLPVIAQRKQEMEQWKTLEMPRRIESNNTIHAIETEIQQQREHNVFAPERAIQGRVASRPGGMNDFSGVTLTLKEFDPTANFRGKILVTPQTDPGWTVIFPLLKGVVVERGGMLSHAAIIARELNIPCIVGAQQATDYLPSNIEIQLDLQTGTIKKL
ncbi:MAG: PEP-utilizing enzyme, partial [bacterium]